MRDDRRLTVAALMLATAVAAALRLPFLGAQSLWFDETFTVHVVHGSLGDVWQRVGATESTPPLFYLLTWGWVHLVGSDGAAAVRTVSALALVAAVPVAYGAVRRLVGERAALATAALLAVSPLLSWYAVDARAYGLLVLVGLLSVWTFAAVLERPRRKRLALWALVAVAAVWTHWFAGFLVLGEALALLWLRRDARRGVLLAGGAALLALLPLVGLLRDQTGDDRASFIADTKLTDRVEQLVRQFGSGQNVPRTWLEGALLALGVGALVAGAYLTVRRALAPRDDPAARDGARALLAVTAIVLLVPLALGAVELYDRFNVRNVLYLWPLVAALAAPALLRLRAVPLAALLALGIAASLWGQLNWRYGNTDWRTAIARVREEAPEAPVVAIGRLGIPVAALYLDRAPAAAPLTTRRAWLVVEPARTPGRRELGPVDPPLVAQLLAAFPRHRETTVHAFRVIELRAPRPVALDPAGLPDGALFPAVRSGAG
jgi:4-amino-4-deoxy-L-arabinose transferase-like glycosyltransferase